MMHAPSAANQTGKPVTTRGDDLELLLHIKPLQHFPAEDQRGVALCCYAAMDNFVNAGDREAAWKILDEGLNLRDSAHAPTRMFPDLAAAEYETLSLLLKDENANVEANQTLLTRALHNHGMLAMGLGEHRVATSSLEKASALSLRAGDSLMASSTYRQLAHLLVKRSQSEGWGIDAPAIGAGLLLQGKHYADLAVEAADNISSRESSDTFMLRASRSTLGHVLSTLAIHPMYTEEHPAAQKKHMDPMYTERQLNAAGVAFLDAERQSAGNGGDNSLLVGLPGDQYVLHILNLADFDSKRREEHLAEALKRAENSLRSARAIRPPLEGQDGPASFNEASALAVLGLCKLATGNVTGGGLDYEQGLEGLRRFGRQDIIDTFELKRRRDSYEKNMLDFSGPAAV